MGQKYTLWDLCFLKCLITILITVILISLGRDVENLVYSISYLAQFMEAAILKIENEAQAGS